MTRIIAGGVPEPPCPPIAQIRRPCPSFVLRLRLSCDMPLSQRVFLMVLDGLRPDSVTSERMPNLARLGAGGVVFQRNHAVFPTVTRANSASLATGVYPKGHGIPGNELVSEVVEQGRPFSTADADRLEQLRESRGGRVVMAATLADRIYAAGGRTAVVGTGSTGAALLQNPQGATRGEAFFHPRRIAGLDRSEIESALGPIPKRTTPNTEQNAFFTKLITDVLCPADAHALIVFWHTDPDHTQHAHGLGHPAVDQALAAADKNLATILSALDERPESWTVVVASDHGFSSVAEALGETDVTGVLIDAGLKASPTSSDVIPVDGGVYLSDAAAIRGTAIVSALDGMPGIGALFSGGNGAPVLPGTMDRTLLGQGGVLTPDIQYSVHWTLDENAGGIAGLCAGPLGRLSGTHGSLSPLEVRNTLIMSGAGIKSGVVSDVPSGTIDVAPTLAELLGVGWDGACDGRILWEGMAGGPAPGTVSVTSDELEVVRGARRQVLRRSTVAGTTYLDQGGME